MDSKNVSLDDRIKMDKGKRKQGGGRGAFRLRGRGDKTCGSKEEGRKVSS